MGKGRGEEEAEEAEEAAAEEEEEEEESEGVEQRPQLEKLLVGPKKIAPGPGPSVR